MNDLSENAHQVLMFGVFSAHTAEELEAIQRFIKCLSDNHYIIVKGDERF